MKFQDSSFNGLKVTVGTKSVTHARMHPRTHARSKSNMRHQFLQSWGYNNVEITPFPENMIEEPLTFCQELFDRIVDELKERSDVKAEDMIRVTLSHPRLDMPICCPFMRAETLTGENIINEIERLMQSNTEFDVSDGDMSVEFTHTVLPSGSGRGMIKQAEYDITESMRFKLRSHRANGRVTDKKLFYPFVSVRIRSLSVSYPVTPFLVR